MTIVSVQGGLVDEGYNAVRLARYAQIQQRECAFWGIANPADPVNEACSPILTLPERAQIARYLGEAQEEIEQVCGYPLSARWFVDQLPYAPILHAKQKKVIEAGVMGTEIISVCEAIDYTTDPTQIGPVYTTATDESEIRIYHTGTDIEIDPSSVTISGHNLTIEIPRCRLVSDAYVDNPEDGLDYTDVPPSATTPFESCIDIRRIYNDPETQAVFVYPHRASESCSCGCWVCGEYTHDACMYVRNGETGAIDVLYAHLVGSVMTAIQSCSCAGMRPELTRIAYYAGLTQNDHEYEQAIEAIIHLAHAKMPRPSCGCGILRDRWDADRVIPDNMTPEQANCKFGPQIGAWLAWQFANSIKSIRMGTL